MRYSNPKNCIVRLIKRISAQVAYRIVSRRFFGEWTVRKEVKIEKDLWKDKDVKEVIVAKEVKSEKDIWYLVCPGADG